MTRNKNRNDFAKGLQRRDVPAAAISGPGIAICNREDRSGGGFALPEDGFFQILPIGRFPGVLETPDGEKHRITQIYDRENLEAMAGELRAAGKELLIDYEHFSHDPEKATNAGGWLTDAEVREDGLYARARWSARGKADVEGGNYRYISAEVEDFSAGEDGGLRPRRLSGAALTNRPQINTLRPLSNREGGAQPETKYKTQDDMDKIIAAIAPFLGLPSGADGDAVLNRLKDIPEGATLDSLLEKAGDYDGVVKDRDALLESQVESDLSHYEKAGVIKDRESVKTMLLHNRESTLKMLEGLRPAETEPPRRVYNRADAKPPDTSVEALNADHDKREAARASRINNRAHAIQRTEKCGWQVAWDKAEREEPALDRA